MGERRGSKKEIKNGGNAIVKFSQKKSIDVIAREVIAGDWGNGDDRKNRLKKAGYDHVKVQNKVNEMLGR